MFNTATRQYEMTDASGSYDWMVENWIPADYTDWADEEIDAYADEIIDHAIENECAGIEDDEKREEITEDLRNEKEYVVAYFKNYRDSARKAAHAVDSLQLDEYTHVEDCIVGMSEDGYWVSDNGEEVEALTRDGAIQILTENLNQ